MVTTSNYASRRYGGVLTVCSSALATTVIISMFEQNSVRGLFHPVEKAMGVGGH